jgi:NADPH-dependent glutamate synthase beta subunit-like oxidoreductase/ferredoxin
MSLGMPEPAERIAPPCRSACPTDKDIPGFLRAIAHGDTDSAWRIAYRDNLFPGVLGWICPRPCELACRLGAHGAPVPVCDLKRWLTSAHEPPPDLAPRPVRGGPAIAVIGAGPAGLAAAHDLTMAGASVTLFDRGADPGGLLTSCIPEFRLPPDVVESDVARILSLGIRFEPGYTLRDAAQLESLMAERGFAAVLLATGAGDDRTPEIPGWRPSPWTRTAIALLRDIRLGAVRFDGLRVAVIGGGNGAIDAARAALRVGATSVEILYRRGRASMPAFVDGIAAADSEGARIRPRMIVSELLWEQRRLTGARCVFTDVRDHEDRSVPPLPLSGTEHFRPYDAMVFAIGQRPTLDAGVGDDPRVFTCGDHPSGSGTVVDAIATGRRAAAALRERLALSNAWSSRTARRHRSEIPEPAPDSVPRPMRANGARVRARATEHIWPGDWSGAVGETWYPAREAGRCLACDRILTLDPELCILCRTCEERCVDDALAWRPGPEGASESWRLTIRDDACQRCGDCVAGCPSGALNWRTWTTPNRICALRTIAAPSAAAASC